MFNTINDLFREYMGTGMIVLLYFASVIYLFVSEKEKERRILFVYSPLILLLIFFCPLFAKLFFKFADGEIYYRILWLMPMTATLAYTAVRLIGYLSGYRRNVAAVAAALVLAAGGRFIYADVNFGPAENMYHVPQSVVDICDAISVDGREIMAAFPAEMVQYVRQYSSSVCMPYGRETLVGRWERNHELADVMEAEYVDAKSLCELAHDWYCHYIILPNDTTFIGNPEEYGYVLDREIDGYLLYKSETADFGLTW